MTEKRFTIKHFESTDWAYDNGEQIYTKDMVELLNHLHEENQELKEENEYLCEKIKENEWHWNTIDEDRDVWIYECKRLEEENKQLKRHNEDLIIYLEQANSTDKLADDKND